MANKKTDSKNKKQNGAAIAKSGCAEKSKQVDAKFSSQYSFIEEVRRVEMHRLRKVDREGGVSHAYFYRPCISGVPESFFAVPEGAWIPYDEAKKPLPTSMRSYVRQLRAEGHEVAVSSCSGGILRFNLVFRGERLALWFNAWTSKTFVLNGDDAKN